MTQHIIMHVDMNSYFASCEQQDNWAWRKLPIGVCEHLGGIIIAPSIEAKQWGIKTGMPVWEARKLYPKIILTRTHPDRYRYYTKKFLNVLADYTRDVEKYSIDEAFLDITKACNISKKNSKSKNFQPIDPFTEAVNIAQEIKYRIKSEVGDYLTCSIGIGWNKLIAKIGSDFQKPNGLTVFRPEDKEKLYHSLKLTDIPGIAKRTERNLRELGIRSLLNLKDYPVSKLVAQFGIMGYHLHRIGQLEGSWKEGFTKNEPIKSMGHMYTLPLELRGKGLLLPVLYKLSEMVAERLRANKFMGTVITAYIKNFEYESLGASKKLGYCVTDGRDIFFESIRILEPLLLKKTCAFGESAVLESLPVKLVSITVSGLRPFVEQKSLFARDEKKKRAVGALDKINRKYGDFTISRVPVWLARDIIRDSIGFGRMKELKTTLKATDLS